MNTVLWVIQFLLALLFGMAGLMKLTQPYEKLAERMAWVNSFSSTQVRLIGGVEILAAFGLLLPGLTGILPWLTPLAAAGLVLDMIGAAYTHLRRHEVPMIVGNLVLLALAFFIAYGRFVALPL